jgi:DNA-binding MarR family transcriptional regulator
MAADPEISSDEWAAWRSFRDMFRRLDQALGRELQRDGDISAPEYEILVTIFRQPDRQMRAKNLAEHLGWEKSRVSHQVTRMEKRGLVQRTNCETDLRGSWIELTANGSRAVLGTMREHSASIRRYFLDVLTPGELAVFSDASTRIRAAVTANDTTDCDADDGADAGASAGAGNSAPVAATAEPAADSVHA